MRFNLVFLTALFLVGTSVVSAQTNVGAMRMLACTINPGSTIADVVETARGFEWADETAPAFVGIRSRVAGSGGSQYDFIIDSYYPSYADMIEKRGAFLRSRAGRNGRRGLAGVATCSDNVLIRNATPAGAVPGGPGSIQPLTAAVSTLCELNGATVADAVAMAGRFAGNLGAGAGVLSQGFGTGSQRIPFNSRVGMRFIFPSYPDFGTAIDRLNQSAAAADPENPISCGVPSLWTAYRIHSRNN